MVGYILLFICYILLGTYVVYITLSAIYEPGTSHPFNISRFFQILFWPIWTLFTWLS